MTQRSERSGVARVAIIGVGAVGATTGYASLLAGAAAGIILVDKDGKRVDGHSKDLRTQRYFRAPPAPSPARRGLLRCRCDSVPPKEKPWPIRRRP
jgi:threonine dehydrogenase-like Zn-dependent dehydrogenase